jgi:hypothetical protein
MTNQWSPGVQANKRQIERQEELNEKKRKAQKSITDLKTKLSIINGRIAACNNSLATFKTPYRLAWIKAGLAAQYGGNPLKNLTRTEVLKIKSDLISEKNDVGRLLNRLQDNFSSQFGGPSAAATTTTTTDGGGGGGSGAPAEVPPATYSKDVVYNASTVKEAYFYTGMSFVNKADPDWQGKGATDKFDSYIWSGNTPGKVNDAKDLWKTTVTSSSKGMIQTWNPPGGRFGAVKGGNFTRLSTSSSIQRYGFQFMYNPTTIEMSYGGVADVDPGMQSSGTEEFLLSNPSVFQSTIGIQIVINRMFDFQYINENGIKSGQISDFYAGNVPDTKTIQTIYDKGTMYDVEFLLQTMFPYEPIDSQLRGKTSDIGFLGASPVELHLGNKLRYVAQINNISVNHAIFDNRMVPLFTTVSVATNRIPDYQGS